MLMNIAEDLKEYAKIKVSPMQEVKEEEKPEKAAASSKKPSKIEDIKKQADSARLRKGEIYNTDDTPIDDDGEALDSLANYVFMELQSTVAFKEIDIDEMLQHTSLDDFLRGLYVKAVEAPGTQTRQTQHDKLLSQLMGTTAESESGRP
jgi:hypothetical protein